MNEHNLKKNTYFVAIGQLAQKVLAFALIPFAARYLGDDGFGKFSLASTIMFFIFLFNDIGINTYITRETAKNKKLAEKYFYNSIMIKFILIFLNFLGLLFYLKLANYSSDTNHAIVIFAGYGIVTSIMQLSIGIFEAFEQMKYEAIIFTFEKVLITTLSIFLLVKGYGLFIFCAVFLFGGMISIALSAYFLNKKFNFRIDNFKLDYAIVKILIKESIPFGLSILIATIYNNAGILFLSLMNSTDVVGWYSASFKFISITNFIPTILIAATYPALSKGIFQENERISKLFTKCMRYLSFIALPMIVGTSILSDKIIYFIYGTEFLNAVASLQILVWAAALVFYNIFFTGILKVANLQQLMVKVQLIGLGINIVSNLFLIKYYSYIGAAISTVGTEAFIFFAYFIIIYRKVVKLQELSFIIKTVLATLLMSIFSICFKDYNFFINVLGSSVIFFCCLYVMKGFFLWEILPTSNK
ncbi:MAG: flippase [Ignavibacteriales bacterium]|nr:flippase [Ignavibacteriales bacterium]